MIWNKASHIDYDEKHPSSKIHAKIPNYEVSRACLNSQKAQSGSLGPLRVNYLLSVVYKLEFYFWIISEGMCFKIDLKSIYIDLFSKFDIVYNSSS